MAAQQLPQTEAVVPVRPAKRFLHTRNRFAHFLSSFLRQCPKLLQEAAVKLNGFQSS